jgi:hypothetical protein
MISVVLEISDSRALEVGVITKNGFAGEALTADEHRCPLPDDMPARHRRIPPLIFVIV